MKRILFVGLNTVDLQFFVEHYPEANTKTKAQHNEIYVGGPATNAAIACAHLGSSVDLYTPIGKHTLSDFILQDIAKYQIRIIDPIAENNSQPVFASIITSQHNGERTILSYHPDNKALVNDHIKFNINDYSLLLFDGFHPELALELAKQARAANIPTVLDGGSWKPGLEELLYHIDMAICSNDFKVPGGKGVEDNFKYLHAAGIKKLAITRGENSILVSENSQRSELTISPIKVKDTLGAGDIFHGAFCHYYSLQHTFFSALEKASVVAGESCKSRGTRAWMDPDS